MKKLGYQLFFYVSILLFLCSLGLTFFETPVGTTPGFFFILGGFLYLLNDPISFIAWLANITFFTCIFSIGKKKNKNKPISSFIYATLTLFLGLMGLGIGKIQLETSSLAMQNAQLSTGYYIWILSFLLLLTSASMRLKYLRK